MDSPDRIEIELVEHEAPASRRRKRHPDSTPMPAPAPPGAPPPFDTGETVVVTGPPATITDSGPLGSEKRRLVVTALAAGVVALFIGWAMGRSGGSGEIAADDGTESSTATTVAVTTEPPDDLGETIPPVASGDLPEPPTTRVVVRPGPTTSTTVPAGWIDDTVVVNDPRLTASGLELVVLSPNRLQTVDLTTGVRSTHRVEPSRTGVPRVVYAGDGWISLYDLDQQTATLFRGHESEEQIVFESNSQMFFQPSTETFVSMEQSVFPADGPVSWTIREFAHDSAEPISETPFELPVMAWAQGPDPAGGVIVYANGGGVFRYDGTNSERLTSGQLFGLSATTIVAYECGDSLDDCATVIVDRTTGERRTVPHPPGAPMSYEPLWNYWGNQLDNVSPNGEYMMIAAFSERRYQYGVLSLVTGEFDPLAQVMNDVAVEWSPDSRLVFFADNGVLKAYDTVSGEVILEMPPDLVAVSSFTIRPVTPTE